MGEKTVNVRIRFPEPLHDEIKTAAVNDLRSLNSEVLILLREALDARRGRPGSRLLHCAEPDASYDTGPADR